MNRLNFNWLVGCVITLTACNGVPQSYTINGTAEGIADGDSIYLQELRQRTFITLESTVVENGQFKFKGKQDSTVSRYITTGKGMQQIHLKFYLENGNINVNLNPSLGTLEGTPNNNAQQRLNDQLYILAEKETKLIETIRNDAVNNEMRQNAQTELTLLKKEYYNIVKESVKNNLDKTFGVDYYTQIYRALSFEENDSILKVIPENLTNRMDIKKIRHELDKQSATQVGKPYVDFTMKDPQGKEVSLSDYIEKGKVVLVDFWASWCPPCRKEIPHLVKLYETYKDKNLEIVGVSLDRELSKWKDGIHNLNISWPQMSDLQYWDNKGADLYGISSIPHLVLIDANGIISARGLHGKELELKIDELTASDAHSAAE